MNILNITAAEYPIDERFRGNEVLISYFQKFSKFNNKVYSENKKFTELNRELCDIESELENMNNYDLTIIHDFSRKYFRVLNESKSNIKSIFFLHCLFELFPFSNQSHKHRNNVELLKKLVDEDKVKLVGVSEAVKKSFSQIFPENIIDVIHGCADPELYKKGNRQELIEADYVVGFSGRPDNIKGAPTLLSVIERFEKENPKNIGFYLALSGGEYKRYDFIDELSRRCPNLIIEDKIKITLDISKLDYDRETKHKIGNRLLLYSIGDEVFNHSTHIGFQNTPLQNNIDLYFHPANSEAFGLSILEAITSGVPVVTSNVGGISEYVNEKNGVLVNVSEATRNGFKQYKSYVEEEDVKAFYNAINEAIDKKYDSKEVSQTVKDKTPQIFTKKLDNVIERYLSK